MSGCAFIPMTAGHSGAIAIVQIVGEVDPVLGAVTGRSGWPVGTMRLVRFDGIDEGLAVRLTENVAQLMPHGGPRVVQRLCARLAELGAAAGAAEAVDPLALYPEAEDEVEALMLAALARAASPLAIDLLPAQPSIWRMTAGRPEAITADDRARSARLNRLITPPLVVLAGPPNVGKSTLSNALLGRSMSIAIDRPGTTRDYTTARLEMGGLVVQWHDTPGIRRTDDPIEAKAIELSRSLIAGADLLIAITDAEHDWPELPRPPEMRIAGKADAARRDDADLSVSAINGEGLRELAIAVREALVPPDDVRAASERPWVFDERLDGPRESAERE